jgi:hypothetical protein
VALSLWRLQEDDGDFEPPEPRAKLALPPPAARDGVHVGVRVHGGAAAMYRIAVSSAPRGAPVRLDEFPLRSSKLLEANVQFMRRRYLGKPVNLFVAGATPKAAVMSALMTTPGWRVQFNKMSGIAEWTNAGSVACVQYRARSRRAWSHLLASLGAQ